MVCIMEHLITNLIVSVLHLTCFREREQQNKIKNEYGYSSLLWPTPAV
jgi:hypothetical protein